MTDVIIKVENVSKRYRLGVIGSGTIREDLARYWNRIRGKPNAHLKIEREQKNISRGAGVDHTQDNDYIWALRHLFFEIKRGEVMGIIGRNGAGKSTLLKILSRVTAPTEGVIKVKGRIASLLEVGTGFHPELTGRENIFLNGAILGMSKDEVKKNFDEIVEFSGVSQFIDTPVKRYSSGMYVRLAFAVAAHLEPEILIIDEVLAVGDVAFQKKCLGKMKSVSRQGRTVLFVSHNMFAIQRLCNRSILLDLGHCVYDGKAENAIENYLSRHVQKGRALFDASTVRSGSGQVKFTSLELIGKNGEAINSIKMLHDFTIKMNFLCKSKITNLHFGVRIYTLLNQNIATWTTRGLDRAGRAATNCGSVQLQITRLNLLPGIYYLGIGVHDNYRQFDYIEDALEIEITASVEAAHNAPLNNESGFLYSPCSWEFNYR